MILKRLLLVTISSFMFTSMGLTPLASALASPATATNLIANPGVETPNSTTPTMPANWVQDEWGTNSETFSYGSADAHSGSYGIGVNMTSYTSGDAKWYFSPVGVTASDSYLFSDYYKSSVPTDVVIQYSDTSGNLSYVDLGEVAASPSSWAQLNDTFTVPANETSMTVFHLINSVGWLNTDDYSLTASVPVPTITITSPTAGSTLSGNTSLTATTTNPSLIASVQFTLDGAAVGSPLTTSPFSLTWNSASTTNGTHSIGAVVTPTSGPSITATPVSVYVTNPNPLGGNLIPNPTDTTVNPTNSNLPQDWSNDYWGTETSSFSYLGSGSGYNGSRALEVNMTKYTSGDAKWYFTPVNVTAGNTYNFSDYYESSVPTDVVIQYNNASGSDSYVDLGNQAASPTSWTKVSSNFTVPTGETQMTVFDLIGAVGSLTTSDFSLTAVAPVPTISLTSPTVNSTLSGNTTLTATTNSSSITSVQFTLDGTAIGSPITASPYSLTWNSASTTNGAHSIGAVLTPVTGTKITATPVNVEVSNAAPLGGNLIPNPMNLIVSPTSSTTPQDWTVDNWGTNTATFTYGAAGSGYNGSRALEVNMTKYTSGDGKWSFTPQNIAPETQYKFSEYYETNVATEVDVVFNMTDGTTEYNMIGLPATASTWTNFTTEFVVPQGTANITIYHFIERVGYLNTSDFSMTPYTPVGFKRPIVTLTFDDGYNNMYTYALPILQADGFNSTQFIITNDIGKSGYMTSTQVKAMYTAGNEIASHTVTHTDLTTETAAKVTTELSQSKTTLQTLTGTPVTDLAYPYGEYNASVVAQVKAYYSAARGVEDGLNSKDNFNAYDLKVQNVFDYTTTAQIADWVAQAQATNTWLILCYHSADPNVNNVLDGGLYNVTPTQLTSELAAIKSSGVTVETMSQALAEVEAQL
jgi:peptidoglycan/xylan/chitin deacetylase (PgdA/CDA1 family)